MVLTVLVFLFVLGVAFYQVAQGLFSALIMTILTALCVGMAFCAYEPLAEAMLYTRQPACADMIMLTALWFVPLLGLRLVADRLIPGNVVFGAWPNRIGAGALGLVTGGILAGAVLVGGQMLPFGPSVMGYQPFDDSLQRVQRVGPFFPDETVTAAAGLLSRGALKAANGFAAEHDDLLLELYCARNTAGLNGRVDAEPGAVAVYGAYEPPADAMDWSVDVPRSPLLDTTGPQRIVIVRAAVSESARDPDNWWRLPATHFRLVTDAGRSHYPVAYLTYWVCDQRGTPRRGEEYWRACPAAVKDGRAQVGLLALQREWRNEPRALVVDWVYRLPAGETPAHLVFRRVAHAGVPEPRKELPPVADAEGKPAALTRISTESRPPI